MSLNCRISQILIFLILVAGMLDQAHAATSFRICAEPDNLPMSQESSKSGYEIEVARIIAKDMGQTLEVKWVAQRDHAYFRQTIGAGECDAIMGVPSGLDD